MKKQIFLTSAMAATLTSLTGCASGDDWDDNGYASADTQVCVDDVGIRVDDMWCVDDDNDGHVYFNGQRYRKRDWYYVYRGSPLPYHGEWVRDARFKGSAAPIAGATYARAPQFTNMTRSAAMARGGFGSSSRSFGGGRS